MFIIVSEDEATILATVRLQKLYPNENVTVPAELNHAPRELNGTSPKRITFFGHGGIDAYGGKSVDEFSAMVVGNLTAYAKKDPSIKSSLSQIDLLGCNVGHYLESRPSFALEVAVKVNSELQKSGFKEIQVNAVSNLLSNNPEGFYSTKFSGGAEGFSVNCVRTEEEYNRTLQNRTTRQEMQTGLNGIKTQMKEVNKALSNVQAEHKKVSGELGEEKSKLKTIKKTLDSKQIKMTEKPVSASAEKEIKRIKHEVSSIREKESTLKKSIESVSAKKTNTEQSISEANKKIQENALLAEKINSSKKELNDAIKAEVNQVYNNAVSSGSKWVEDLKACSDALNSQKNVDVNASLAIVKNSIGNIRSGWFGSEGFFNPGSTSATKLEGLVNQTEAKNNLLEANEQKLGSDRSVLERNANQLNKNLTAQKNELSQLKKEKTQLNERKTSLKQEYTEQQSNIHLKAYQETSKKVGELEKTLTTLEAKKAGLESKKSGLAVSEEKVNTRLEHLAKEEKSLRIMVHKPVEDPRTILDNPRCNFTALAQSEGKLAVSVSKGIR